MYNNFEIQTRNTWSYWLASFVIGEQRVIDETDRKRLASSISTNFHKTKKATFKIFKDKVSKETYCKRIN